MLPAHALAVFSARVHPPLHARRLARGRVERGRGRRPIALRAARAAIGSVAGRIAKQAVHGLLHARDVHGADVNGRVRGGDAERDRRRFEHGVRLPTRRVGRGHRTRTREGRDATRRGATRRGLMRRAPSPPPPTHQNPSGLLPRPRPAKALGRVPRPLAPGAPRVPPSPPSLPRRAAPRRARSLASSPLAGVAVQCEELRITLVGLPSALRRAPRARRPHDRSTPAGAIRRRRPPPPPPPVTAAESSPVAGAGGRGRAENAATGRAPIRSRGHHSARPKTRRAGRNGPNARDTPRTARTACGVACAPAEAGVCRRPAHAAYLGFVLGFEYERLRMRCDVCLRLPTVGVQRGGLG